MYEEDSESYIQYLWTKYQTDDEKINKIIAPIFNELRDKFDSVRDIIMNFSIDEIHDLHMCISECIAYHEQDECHKKEHPDSCEQCEDYEKLYDRIVEKCNCIDNPKLKLKC